ncbi:STAS domain-containing protein [bacterium AH-315-J21]|nr:STAS domain-containing protein [bacterium AH-315-J21]
MFKPKILQLLPGYNRTTFTADLFAGVTVGLIALPMAMAFAVASGVPPERGLFTAIVAGFLISALGGSRVQIGGPTGAFVVIVAGIVAKFGYEGLVYCTLMAGGLLIIFGLFRMGGLIRFIPFPVTTGFTTGIAVLIFSTQVKDFLGLQLTESSSSFIGQWYNYSIHFNSLDPTTAAIGIGTMAIILLLRAIFPRLPAMLIAMIIATAVASMFQLDIATISSQFGELPRSLPAPRLPSFEFAQLKELVMPAFTVAMLGAMESLLSATVADGMTGGRHKPNVELIAQGIANIGSAIFGGIPATGAIARTATNVKSGAKTPVAGLIQSATLVLLLFSVAPLASKIPLATLAGILMVVSYDMSELKNVGRFVRLPRSDAMVLLSTFSLTLLVDLVVAVEVGIVLAAMLFIRRMSEVANVEMITRDLRGDDPESPDPNSIAVREVPEKVEVFEIQGPFFFGAANKFQDAMQRLDRDVVVIILRLRSVPAIDATGLYVLTEFHRRCHSKGVSLVLSGVHSQPLNAMIKSKLIDEIGMTNIYGHIDDALNGARVILGLPEQERHLPFVPSVIREGRKPDSGDNN